MLTTRSAPTACLSMNQHSFDEQPVRVGLLLLRAAELLQALGGLLEAQVHAVGRAIRTPSL